MTRKAERKVKNLLSIESAVAGGSVALIFAESGTLVRHEGNDSSRAEKILSVIYDVLDEAGLALRELDMIAVSTGPGSFSGIRIGLSTALGLTAALNIPLTGVPVLEAMANAATCNKELIAAVPVGKSDVAWQSFEIFKDGYRRATAQPVLTSTPSFIGHLEASPNSTLFAHPDLLERIAGVVPASMTWIDAGRGLAEYVARLASSLDAPATPPLPIYLRNRDAAARSGAF